MSVEQLQTILSSNQDVWFPPQMPPVPEDKIQAGLARVNRHPVPDELVELYRHANGMSFGTRDAHMYVYDWRSLQSQDADQASHQGLTSALYFANYNRRYMLFVDVDGSLGRGAGAVYSCRHNYPPDKITYCTASIAELFDLTARGFRPWYDEANMLQFVVLTDEERVTRMNALLDRKPPEDLLPPDEARLVLLDQVRQPVPADLRAFYQRNDGAFYMESDKYPYSIYLDILCLPDVAEFDADAAYIAHTELPSALIFARTNGGEVLYTDVDGSLGHGAGAVYYDSLSAMYPGNSVRCAASVVQALELLEQGIEPWNVEYEEDYDNTYEPAPDPV